MYEDTLGTMGRVFEQSGTQVGPAAATGEPRGNSRAGGLVRC